MRSAWGLVLCSVHVMTDNYFSGFYHVDIIGICMGEGGCVCEGLFTMPRGRK